MIYKKRDREAITESETRVKFTTLARWTFSEARDTTRKQFAENGEATQNSRNDMRLVQTAPTAPLNLIGRLIDTTLRRTTK